jgi:hypothetical protein
MKKPKLTKTLIEAVKTACQAEAYLETVRPIIEGYQKEILEKHQFKIDNERWKDYGFDLEKEILETKDTYKMKDSDFQIYFKECELKHIEHGFVVKEGCCPLLVAESMLRNAKHEVKIAAKYIHKMSNDDMYRMNLEQSKKLYDLIIKLVFSLLTPKQLEEIKKPL